MLLPFVLFACAHPPSYVGVVPPDAPPREPGTPPFTTEELQAGMPLGTTFRLRLEEAGKPPVEQRWEVTEHKETSYTIHETIWENGLQIADHGDRVSTWAALMDQADFRGEVVVEDEHQLQSPLGLRMAHLYTVTAADGTVSEYSFLPELPGPPVRYTVRKDGETLMTLTVVERH